MTLDGITLGVLGLALGVFGTNATLGRQVAEVIVMLKDLTRRVEVIEAGGVFVHRRKTD